jgi:hypothetical protein
MGTVYESRNGREAAWNMAGPGCWGEGVMELWVQVRPTHTWSWTFINTAALARWKDGLRTGKLFQLFISGRGKPLKRLRGSLAALHRAEAPVLMSIPSAMRAWKGQVTAASLLLSRRNNWILQAVLPQSLPDLLLGRTCRGHREVLRSASSTPSLHHSTTPSLHHSITPTP